MAERDPSAVTAAPTEREESAVEAIRVQLAQARYEGNAGRAAVALALLDEIAPSVAAVAYGPVKTEEALLRGGVLEMLWEYEAAERSLRRALELATHSRQWELLHTAACNLMFVVGVRQRRFAEGSRYREFAGASRDARPPVTPSLVESPTLSRSSPKAIHR